MSRGLLVLNGPHAGRRRASAAVQIQVPCRSAPRPVGHDGHVTPFTTYPGRKYHTYNRVSLVAEVDGHGRSEVTFWTWADAPITAAVDIINALIQLETL